jgi:hypothetical protein
MKLSYLVTCSTETTTLRTLLDRLIALKESEDEIVAVRDTDVNERGKETVALLESYGDKIQCHAHSLDRNYGQHKNHGNSKCTGQFICQLDGDECPTETLVLNLKDIILANTGIEMFYVSRINDYKGVTEAHAKQWGWRLTPCPVCDGRPIVNHPDFQSRVYKNVPDRIKWDRRLHEKIEGHMSYAFLPPDDYELALYHDKTIETQVQTNLRYNEWFSHEENCGHKVL